MSAYPGQIYTQEKLSDEVRTQLRDLKHFDHAFSLHFGRLVRLPVREAEHVCVLIGIRH